MVGTRGNVLRPANDAESKPTLHIECCIKQPEPSPSALADRVERWLRNRYVTVKLKQTILRLDGFHNPAAINFIAVADLTTSNDLEFHVDIHLTGVNISVDVFELHGDEEQIEPSDHTRLRMIQDANNDIPRLQSRTMNLPSQNLHDIWNSLVFEDLVQYRLLKSIVRMISFSARQCPQNLPKWSRIVLLYGPPGTGKTSLCKALAQQLSIRLITTFPFCKLVEFDAHSMLSQYFGESGKAVSKIFDTIEAMLDDDQSTLFCIFIDEIESLASKRQCSGNSNEPQDSLRAVNAFLIALDRLRHRSNVLVFCTSNLVKALDPGFLDRIDIKQYIPDPDPRARYEILRYCYIELAQCGIIAPTCRRSEAVLLKHSRQLFLLDEDEDELGSSSPQPPPHPVNPAQSPENFHILDDRDLPPHYLMMLHFSADEESLPRTLWKIALKSTNLSARTLRRLPAMSIATFAKQDPCPLDEALGALSQAVDNEMSQRKENSTEEMKMMDCC